MLAQAPSEPEIAQAGMLVRPPPQRPVELPVAFRNGEIVDAGVPHPVETVLVILPILIAIGTKPVPRIVPPLVRETNRDVISSEGPQLFDQPIFQLLRPLALSAIRTFWMAVSRVNGGRGGRLVEAEVACAVGVVFVVVSVMMGMKSSIR